MRSSTCTTWTLRQGTSSTANRVNICQGVRPPLTAITNRPRAATAARAAAAMWAAAAAATAGSSAKTSTFTVPAWP